MTHSIQDHLNLATSEFEKAGIEHPADEAEYLMSWVLDCSIPELRLRKSESFDPQLEQRWADWQRRRARREPAQHIIGVTNFMGYDFEVGPQALIPRPETELLVVESVRLLKERSGQPRFVELGIGTGCVSISTALESPHSEGIGLEISPSALDLASRNLRKHADSKRLGSRLKWIHSDVFSNMPVSWKNGVDLLISNPPYIPQLEISELQPEVRDFDPPLALAGGEDGLDFYRMIAEESPQFLTDTGWAALEIGSGQWKSIESIFQKENWVVEAPVLDYNRIPRIFLAHR